MRIATITHHVNRHPPYTAVVDVAGHTTAIRCTADQLASFDRFRGLLATSANDSRFTGCDEIAQAAWRCEVEAAFGSKVPDAIKSALRHAEHTAGWIMGVPTSSSQMIHG